MDERRVSGLSKGFLSNCWGDTKYAGLSIHYASPKEFKYSARLTSCSLVETQGLFSVGTPLDPFGKKSLEEETSTLMMMMMMMMMTMMMMMMMIPSALLYQISRN